MVLISTPGTTVILFREVLPLFQRRAASMAAEIPAVVS